MAQPSRKRRRPDLGLMALEPRWMTVTARDSAGREVSTTFRIQVGGGAVRDGGQTDPKPAPQGERSGKLAPERMAGKLAFTQQLKNGGRVTTLTRLTPWG